VPLSSWLWVKACDWPPRWSCAHFWNSSATPPLVSPAAVSKWGTALSTKYGMTETWRVLLLNYAAGCSENSARFFAVKKRSIHACFWSAFAKQLRKATFSLVLTEVFPCFFLSCKANARVTPVKMGHGPHSSQIFVLFYVLFVLCRSVYRLCVNVYWLLPPAGYPTAVNKYIISFRIEQSDFHRKDCQEILYLNFLLRIFRHIPILVYIWEIAFFIWRPTYIYDNIVRIGPCNGERLCSLWGRSVGRRKSWR
jgi:hypothetical protein